MECEMECEISGSTQTVAARSDPEKIDIGLAVASSAEESDRRVIVVPTLLTASTQRQGEREERVDRRAVRGQIGG